MIDDCAPVMLLSAEFPPQTLPARAAASLFRLDSHAEQLSNYATHNPRRDEVGLDPDHLAYVIYTSGSTGRPKGVMVSHRSVMNYLAHASTRYLEEATKGAVVSSALGFDATLTTLLTPLISGKVVRLLPENETTLSRLAELLFEGKEGWLFKITPAHLQALEHVERSKRVGAARHRIVVGGEQLVADTLRKWKKYLPNAIFVNEYGPTETVVGCSVWELSDARSRMELERMAAAPIGRPIANMRIYILDSQMQPVPQGVTGELFLGGDGLARGYLNLPALTARRFVEDPFSRKPGARMYQTGDLARWRADGEIAYIGRADFQVKIRGFRVELGEIESNMRNYPGVRDAVVLLREDEPGDQRLVAYVVFLSRTPGDLGGLRSYLQHNLPGYMMPAHFVVLDDFPLTANGKINRNGMPAPLRQSHCDEESRRLPRTPVEELIAQTWAEILRVEHVRSNDDFFALGGHSLLATQVMARMRSNFGVDLPLRLIFESPTVAALATEVERALGAHRTALPEITRVERTGEMPVSFAQQRLWFLDRMMPGDVSYNVPVAARITGPLLVDALKKSLREVVQRHESLRTRFVTVQDEPRQLIDDEARLDLVICDLGSMPEEEREVETERLMAEEVRRPFDLALGPLLRANLLRCGEQNHVLLLTIHHIVSDGWSVSVLVREVAELYRAFAKGQPSPLVELLLQYADYSVWQRKLLGGELLEQQLGYWKKRLDGAAPSLDLPTDRPRPAAPSTRGALLHVELEAALVREMRKLGRAQGATLYMVLLAAFQILLHRYSRQQDILLGSPIAGRTMAELEGLIGFFANTLVMRTEIVPGATFTRLLAQVRDTTLEAYAHQDVPFEKLVEQLSPQRNLSRTPLFQVMLILQNAPAPELELGEARLQPLIVHTGSSKFDLTLSLEQSGEALEGFIEYSTDLWDESTVGRMMEHFRTLLGEIVARPEQPVWTLNLSTQRERRQVLEEWNRTQAPVCGLTIHELFEQQAERTPGVAALIQGERQITYHELNRRANQLAHALRQRGIRYDKRVGIYIPRSIEHVIAVLAVLKSGGAYVPLDPGYPAERLQYMIEAAKIPIVITDGAAPDHIRETELGCLDLRETAHLRGRDDNPGWIADSRSDAYIIFTSGSTGRPNGVAGTHQGAVNRFTWMWEQYPFVAGEVSALKTSPNFVDSVWETFGPLLQGIPSVILDDETVKSPRHLVKELRAAKATRIVLVPSLLRMLLDEEPELAKKLPCLKYWTSSGETLPVDLQQRFRKTLPGRVLLNLYGASEASADSTALDVTEIAACTSIPIGRPIYNTRVYLLDAEMNPAPLGVPGEIYVGGMGLAQGYLFQPELTATRFVPDPFSGEPGARLYRALDLGRHNPDGTIEYAGRMDRQVKIRGNRIDLLEIEMVLAKHPLVKQTAVLAVKDSLPSGDKLVAYVVPHQQPGPEVAGLRQFLKPILPEYMVPSIFVMLERLPLTPSGKLNRMALPEPKIAVPENSYVAPVTDTEIALTEIWGALLNRNPKTISATANLFDLGGHSLLLMRLLSEIRNKCGVELSIKEVMRHPQLNLLAQLILEAGLRDALSISSEYEVGADEMEITI